MEPLILASARKHGIVDIDMLHVIHNPSRVYEQADGMVIFIGPTEDGTLLEVGAIAPADYDNLIIAHAMKARPKYLR